MQQTVRHYSVDEYLGTEEVSSVKHEFDSGDIFAMSGASQRHNDIALNLYAAFRSGLVSRGCGANVSDVRLRTPSGLYAYPDVMVVCGPTLLTGERPDTVTNPIILVEVLSNSTRDYDRTRKFDHYRSIPTLRHCVFVDQDIIDVAPLWRHG